MSELETQDEEKKEPLEVDLVICTPGNAVQKDYLMSLLALIHHLSVKGIKFVYSIQSSSHVADAREQTLQGSQSMEIQNSSPFLGNIKYKKILWIDSDITFTTDDFDKLWESDKDIVGGMYLLTSGATAVHVNQVSRPLNYDEVKDKEELFKVWGTGFGFLMVAQGVFESLPRPWFQSVPITKTFDNGDSYSFSIIGEDLSWCESVSRKGYEVWIDPTVKLIHNKQMKLTWEGIRP